MQLAEHPLAAFRALPPAARVWWTELERFNGDKQAVPYGVCSVLLPPSASPPPTWRPAGSRPDWALWTSPHCAPSKADRRTSR
ncbi:hypothetical protein SAMN05421505_107182 [Sinosporangium album]|uniref:Uncharacterized protein n=2 Tax=Sinosporangium album TaxID=504805 RepID=A0A1G7WT65_9ACTN|nr:hypothetical protein SAMN05421505_107182 [Sinosporangium album]